MFHGPISDVHNTHTAISKSSISDKEERIHVQHTPTNEVQFSWSQNSQNVMYACAVISLFIIHYI